MILAIDLGSTSFKAAVYDRQLRLLGSGGHPVETRFLPGNRVEIEAAAAEAAFRGAVTAALAAAGIGAEALTALAIDSQAQTFTIADADGKARMPFISWQDCRAGAACEALRADPSLADAGKHGSFGELLAPLHVCQLRHLHDRQPGWIRSSDQVLHLPTWFVRQLSGEAVIDDNLAAMSGLYSMLDRGWWMPAVKAVGLTASQLPRLTGVGTGATRTGSGAAAWGLPAGLPIVLAGNDQTAGGYGARVEELNAALVTLGTAQVGYAASALPAAPGPSRVRGPYPGGLHYTLVCDQVGGNVINWAQTVLPGVTSPEAFFALAAQAEAGCRGLCFVCDLHASGGTWQGIGFHTTPAELARSVVEGLSRRLVKLVAELPVTAPRYLVAGGGSKSPLWLAILAQDLGAPLEPVTADPLAGAARMATEALMG